MNPDRRRAALEWLPARGLMLLWAGSRLLLLIGLDRMDGAGDGVMPLTFQWVQEMLAGQSPYHDRGVAYPPLAMFFFALTGIGANISADFALRFVAALLLVDFIGLCFAHRAETEGRRFAGPAYCLALPCVGPILLLWRYDLIPAVCHLAAGLFMLRGFRRLSWAALGLGIALKPYLVIVLPFWAAWEMGGLLPRPRRRIFEGIALAALPSLVAAVAMLPLSGLDFASAYTFQASRGLQVESTPAVALAELAKAGVTSQKAVFSPRCLCWERTGPLAGRIGALSTALAIAGMAFLIWSFGRRASTEAVLVEKALRASSAAVLITLVTYRVFSPQYLVWALVPVALVVKSRGGTLASLLIAGAGLVAIYLYPLHYAEVINHSGAGRWLMIGRTLALFIAALLLFPPGFRRPAR